MKIRSRLYASSAEAIMNSDSTTRTSNLSATANAVELIPLQLKHLIFIDYNASHANGLWPIRDIFVDIVNSNHSLLPAYLVGVEMYDTKYNIDSNVGKTIQLFNKYIANDAFTTPENSTDVCEEVKLGHITAPAVNSSCREELRTGQRAFPLFFGPGYSGEAKVLGRLAPLYNLATISWSASSPELSDHTKYPTFFRLMLSSDEQIPLPRALCNYFNITTVYLAMMDDSYATDPMEKIDFDLRTHNITVLAKSKFLTQNNDTIDLMLDSLRVHDARIIFFWSNEYDEYHIFCRSIDRWRVYNERFSPDKFLVVFMSLDDGGMVITPPDMSDVPGCSHSALATMLNGSLVIETLTWAPAVPRLDWGMSTVEFVAKAEELGRTRYGHKDGKLSPLAALAIDSLWLGFLALDAVDRRLRAESPNPRTLLDFTFDSQDIAQMTKEELVKFRFRGMTGDVEFRNNGEIKGNMSIQQYQPGQVNRSDFLNMLTYDPESQLLTRLDTDALVFGTIDGNIPPDKAPSSALSGTNLVILLVAVVAGIIVLLCTLVICAYFVYKRKLLEASLNNPAWLVDWKTLVIRVGNGSSTTSPGISQRSFSVHSQVTIADEYHTTAYLNDQLVRIQTIPPKAAQLPRNLETHKFLLNFRDNIQHPHVVRWLGYSKTTFLLSGGITDANLYKNRRASQVFAQYLLWEHCEKNLLEQVVENNALTLDIVFECAIMLDVAQGMAFLHKCSVVSNAHGGLCAKACVIDKRFSVKVADYGDELLANLFELRSLLHDGEDSGRQAEKDASPCSERMLYWAPELLRNRNELRSITNSAVHVRQAADIYAYAITMHVLLTRAAPFDASDLPAEEILELVRETARPSPFRPETITTMQNTTDSRLLALLQNAWAENPEERPPFKDIVRQLQIISGVNANSSVTDQLLQRLERYAGDMEQLVFERTQELQAQQKRADELLNSMLPAEIATQLKRHGQVQPELFENVTIYFSDIVGFTTLSAISTPIEVVNLLNALYTMFDMQIDLFDTYKVETIGDAYMVVSGLPRRNGYQHAAEIGKLSLTLLERIQAFIIPHKPGEKLRLRIGLHTGSCVAGVVGVKMPRYCLFGDTVNTASRMESTGEALRIHVSESAKLALDLVEGFVLEERGQLEVKGKGTMITYWLVAFQQAPSRQHEIWQ